jgi:hypothetical protein
MANEKLIHVLQAMKALSSSVRRKLTDSHHALQNQNRITGLTRVYTPNNEEGDRLPAENQILQIRSWDGIQEVSTSMQPLFDVVAQRDWANCTARADVVVRGETLIKDAPVPYLLWLEEELKNLKTFVDKLHVLDPSENWTFDPTKNAFVTASTFTNRTQKVRRALVLHAPAEHHPAQVESYNEDVVVGRWEQMKFSGALPLDYINDLRTRVEELTIAVKKARETANETAAPEVNVGKAIFSFIFPAMPVDKA